MLCAAGELSEVNCALAGYLRSAFCCQGIDPDGEFEWGGRPSTAWFFHLSEPELIPVRHAQKDMDLGVEPANSNPRTSSITALRVFFAKRGGNKDDQRNAQ